MSIFLNPEFTAGQLVSYREIPLLIFFNGFSFCPNKFGWQRYGLKILLKLSVSYTYILYISLI